MLNKRRLCLKNVASAKQKTPRVYEKRHSQSATCLQKQLLANKKRILFTKSAIRKAPPVYKSNFWQTKSAFCLRKAPFAKRPLFTKATFAKQKAPFAKYHHPNKNQISAIKYFFLPLRTMIIFPSRARSFVIILFSSLKIWPLMETALFFINSRASLFEEAI